MSIYISDILKSIELCAPSSLAESWDNVGLLVGNSKQEVHKVLVALDPTLQTVEETISCGAELLLTHHPAIFSPLSSIDTASPQGAFLQKALQHNVSHIASHTNLDHAAQGVSHALATALGLVDCEPLLPGREENSGLGCLASFAEPISWQECAGRIIEVLGLAGIQLAGKIPTVVSRVGLCGGSGSGFARAAYERGADLYISAEIKHDVARWAEDSSFCLVDAGHYATEQFAVSLLVKILRDYAGQNGWELEVIKSVAEKAPFSLVTKDNFKR